MLGIFVGIIAFKVCLASRADVYTLYLQFWLWGLAHSRRMCLVGIDGPAGTRREALFARARVKQRDCVVVIDTACAITQHLIGYIARYVSIARSQMGVPCARAACVRGTVWRLELTYESCHFCCIVLSLIVVIHGHSQHCACDAPILQ